MKKQAGEDWEEAVAVDSAIREARHEKGFDLFVHDARQPLADAVTIPADFGADQLELDLGGSCDDGVCHV